MIIYLDEKIVTDGSNSGDNKDRTQIEDIIKRKIYNSFRFGYWDCEVRYERFTRLLSRIYPTQFKRK